MRLKPIVIRLAALIAIVAGWQLVANGTTPLLVPSPMASLQALLELFQSGEIYRQLGVSAMRMFIGFAAGFTTAFACGLLAGKYDDVYEFFRPLLSCLLGIPPILFVILAMIWFGTGPLVPIFVVAVLVFPTIYLNLANGWKGIDPALLEMAAVYRVPARRVLRQVILPSLALPVLTGLSLALGSAIRITIMAELLGAEKGIGYSIALARNYLETPRVFAWAIVCILVVTCLEKFVIKPLEAYALKWKTDNRS